MGNAELDLMDEKGNQTVGPTSQLYFYCTTILDRGFRSIEVKLIKVI